MSLASHSQEPLVWQVLGILFLVVGVLGVLGGLAETISSPFQNRRNRRKRIEDAFTEGGQEAVDRYVESSEIYKNARREHVKRSIREGVVGDNDFDKAVGRIVLVAIVIAAVIALTR